MTMLTISLRRWWRVAAVAVVATLGMTIWVGMAFAQSSTCEALEPGDLFTVPDDSTVYIMGEAQTRLYFENSEMYHTWYPDFDDLHIVPNNCLDEIPFATRPFGLTYRPGSFMVKSLVSPKVYGVLPNRAIAHISNESAAAGLYGAGWQSRVRDVHDAHWVNYTNRVNPITAALPHVGMIVRFTDSDTVFYVSDTDTLMPVRNLGASPVELKIHDLNHALDDTDFDVLNESVRASTLVGNPLAQIEQSTNCARLGDKWSREDVGLFTTCIQENWGTALATPFDPEQGQLTRIRFANDTVSTSGVHSLPTIWVQSDDLIEGDIEEDAEIICFDCINFSRSADRIARDLGIENQVMLVQKTRVNGQMALRVHEDFLRDDGDVPAQHRRVHRIRYLIPDAVPGHHVQMTIAYENRNQLDTVARSTEFEQF